MNSTRRNGGRRRRNHTIRRGGGIFASLNAVRLRHYIDKLEERLTENKIAFNDLRTKYMNLGLY